MMLLEYPETFEEVVLRQHDRLLCSFEAEVRVRRDVASQSQGESLAQGDAGDASAGNTVQTASTIIDLSEGGCQLVTSIARPVEQAAGSRLAVASLAERQGMETLSRTFAKGRLGQIAFELPDPAAAVYDDVPIEIRWSRLMDCHLFSGVRFCETPVGLEQQVATLINYQKRYFSRDFQPL